jgi:hypothetical protein
MAVEPGGQQWAGLADIETSVSVMRGLAVCAASRIQALADPPDSAGSVSGV